MSSPTSAIADRIAAEMQAAQPSVVFHLAAQAIVRTAYAEPREAFETNVMGTVNVLEAARSCASVRAVVIVTSDKCYENHDRDQAFKETDAMGGRDPYSASKGCAELVTAAYRQSFFTDGAAVASVRAGNVIGGGDWAPDRIIPDSVRALVAGEPIVVRNPDAVRPWQHVLEPLSGYLRLGALMLRDGHAYEGAWNFGPTDQGGDRPVRWVVDRFLSEWGSGTWTTPSGTDGRAARGPSAQPRQQQRHVSGSDGHPSGTVRQPCGQTASWYREYYRAPARSPRAGRPSAPRRTRTTPAPAGLPWAVEEGGSTG